TEPAAASSVDDSGADVDAGTAGADTAVGASDAGADGEVQLQSAVHEEFGGSALPAAWFATPWEAGGGATVTGGSLLVNGARSGTTADFGPGRTVEFTGTFAAAAFQHVGFGIDYNDPPWAMFSTGGGSLAVGLYARTAGPSTTNTPIPGVTPTDPHRYRIVWRPAGVDFFVDGDAVATHDVGLTANMRPLASDVSADGPDVAVHWLRMSPYAATGTYLSRVFDGGQAGTDWLTLGRTASAPGAATLTFATRSGGTPTPDGSWSDWQAVGGGDAIASPNARYLQYRAVMASSDDTVTRSSVGVTVSHQP
ncbi:MAG: large repetitive protein, partial [Thermoleophilaceae bacterium]|nr:large repetitive protein [Thermoleophilaceae bacterium]